MLPCFFPSMWRNAAGATWRLNLHRRTPGDAQGNPGVTATCTAGPGADHDRGIVTWEDHQGSLVLHLIDAVPQRNGLGCLLMFVFANQGVDMQIGNLSIANANPGEHGFYRYMGFAYDPVQYLANFALSPAMGQIVPVPLNDGGTIDMIRVQIATTLIGQAPLVKTRSEVSCEKMVGAVQRWSCIG